MEKDKQKGEIDWVQVRSECSIGKAYQRLRLEVEADINKRNGLREEGARYKFGIESEAHAFTAYQESNLGQRAIYFHLADQGIVITHANGDVICEANPTINEDGKCCLKVNGKQMEFWQVRLLALENLFFKDR